MVRRSVQSGEKVEGEEDSEDPSSSAEESQISPEKVFIRMLRI